LLFCIFLVLPNEFAPSLGQERGLEYDLLSSHYPTHISETDTHLPAAMRRSHAKSITVSDLSRSAVQQVFLKAFPLRIDVALAAKKASNQDVPLIMASKYNGKVGILPPVNATINGRNTVNKASKAFIHDAMVAAKQSRNARVQKQHGVASLPTLVESDSTQSLSASSNTASAFPSRKSTYTPGTAQVLRSRYKSGKLTEMSSTADILSESVICRRAELLVKAAYILTGENNIHHVSSLCIHRHYFINNCLLTCGAMRWKSDA
jgi:hypothetical protein